jgi:DNA-binding NarL/FixJ family response regulator
MVAGGRPADSDSHERIRISFVRTFLTAGGIGQGKKIIVDDSKIVCERLDQMLIHIAGVEIVEQARNAPDAIRFISESNPDVVILDIRLPGKSSIDVLKDIRAKKLPVRVIMLTNYPYPQYRKKCEELGADYFFDKVTEIEKISNVIKELAKNKPGNVKKK